jgi:hypothetical protein
MFFLFSFMFLILQNQRTGDRRAEQVLLGGEGRGTHMYVNAEMMILVETSRNQGSGDEREQLRE